MKDRIAIAYFSMGVGLKPAMPTYSGGLGILADDTLFNAQRMVSQYVNNTYSVPGNLQIPEE